MVNGRTIRAMPRWRRKGKQKCSLPTINLFNLALPPQEGLGEKSRISSGNFQTHFQSFQKNCSRVGERDGKLRFELILTRVVE